MRSLAAGDVALTTRGKKQTISKDRERGRFSLPLFPYSDREELHGTAACRDLIGARSSNRESVIVQGLFVDRRTPILARQLFHKLINYRLLERGIFFVRSIRSDDFGWLSGVYGVTS